MKIGRILSKLRIEKGLNQADVARELGISKGAVGMWETDKRKPDYDMLVRLADLFGVSTDYILSHNVDSNSNNDKTMQYKASARDKIVSM